MFILATFNCFLSIYLLFFSNVKLIIFCTSLSLSLSLSMSLVGAFLITHSNKSLSRFLFLSFFLYPSISRTIYSSLFLTLCPSVYLFVSHDDGDANQSQNVQGYVNKREGDMCNLGQKLKLHFPSKFGS